jgi:hypothetical protein
VDGKNELFRPGKAIMFYEYGQGETKREAKEATEPREASVAI